ncbi:hypothetical protein ABWA25_17940 [Clostridioides difficile]|uniref:hypothetical protein n=1 Tax=Clostridioides difficile TaxID=1496 RepID=UPI00188A845C|nr:hypothetical protein [Clostridioides difficile]EJX3465910.1 hypothetical protein [Clostridioides difficile]EKS6825674.1 hypothetical protein [Clostridioides difficile]EKS7089922.1 hypothetical protein [Clostridioides difficile]MBF4702333.1 hypothetical protein [Clostridioides difficile]MDO0006848.1 hypothetical protein [Clostridioides difficile]
MIALEKFAGGVLKEKFNTELQKVLDNIADPNTDFKKTRKISLEIVFKANEDRDLAEVDIKSKATIVEAKATTTKVLIGKDLETGRVEASEFKNQVAGQLVMDIPDSEETNEKEDSAGVIDFRNASSK